MIDDNLIQLNFNDTMHDQIYDYWFKVQIKPTLVQGTGVCEQRPFFFCPGTGTKCEPDLTKTTTTSFICMTITTYYSIAKAT